MDELLAGRERLNRVSADFLKVDLETALTFVKIARETRDASRRNRNLRAARKAYDTVHAFVRKIALEAQESQVIHGRMTRLKSELEALGETF